MLPEFFRPSSKSNETEEYYREVSPNLHQKITWRLNLKEVEQDDVEHESWAMKSGREIATGLRDNERNHGGWWWTAKLLWWWSEVGGDEEIGDVKGEEWPSVDEFESGQSEEFRWGGLRKEKMTKGREEERNSEEALVMVGGGGDRLWCD